MAGDPTRMSAADIEAARHLAASFPAISDEGELRARAARLASAVRRMAPEVERLTKERDALDTALSGALETYRIHRQVRHPEPLADCITCGMGASIVNHLPPHLCAALTHPTEGTPSA